MSEIDTTRSREEALEMSKRKLELRMRIAAAAMDSASARIGLARLEADGQAESIARGEYEAATREFHSFNDMIQALQDEMRRLRPLPSERS